MFVWCHPFWMVVLTGCVITITVSEPSIWVYGMLFIQPFLILFVVSVCICFLPTHVLVV